MARLKEEKVEQEISPSKFFSGSLRRKSNEKGNCPNARSLHWSYKPDRLHIAGPPSSPSSPLHRCFGGGYILSGLFHIQQSSTFHFFPFMSRLLHLDNNCSTSEDPLWLLCCTQACFSHLRPSLLSHTSSHDLLSPSKSRYLSTSQTSSIQDIPFLLLK